MENLSRREVESFDSLRDAAMFRDLSTRLPVLRVHISGGGSNCCTNSTESKLTVCTLTANVFNVSCA